MTKGTKAMNEIAKHANRARGIVDRLGKIRAVKNRKSKRDERGCVKLIPVRWLELCHVPVTISIA